MKPHDVDTMTLRDCFEAFILPDLTNAQTIANYRHNLNRWEKHTDNPPVARISNRTLADFRDRCLQVKLSPATFNGNRNVLRIILRRIGPAEYRNPLGEGLIPRVPFVKRLPEALPLPRIWTLDELGRMYDCCDVAQYPRGELPPADFWRTLLVVGFHFCARRSDLLGLRMEAIDWENGVVRWTARKTKKWHVLPLVHPVVVAHLHRVWDDREYVLPRRGDRPVTIGSWARLKRTFQRIQQAAGLTDFHGLHTLRKSGASYIESVAPGLASYILGHSLRGVTAIHYLNPSATGGLADALRSQPQPESFAKILAEPAQSKSVLARQTPARAVEWEFDTATATWKGRTLAFRGCRGTRLLRGLQLLVTARRPLTVEDFQRFLFWERATTPTRVRTLLNQLRRKLIDGLQLPPLFEPIGWNADNSGWILRLP
jgi:integrase